MLSYACKGLSFTLKPLSLASFFSVKKGTLPSAMSPSVI